MNHNHDCEKQIAALEERVDLVRQDVEKLKDDKDKGRFIGGVIGSAITFLWDSLVNH